MFDKIESLISGKYPAEYCLLTHGGKLDGDWSNVRRHCLIQAVAAEVLADFLGLDEVSKRKLASVAVAHDWRKRLDIVPSDFTEHEKRNVVKLLSEARLDEDLMNALNPQFLLRVHNTNATFLELVQFYLDDIALNDCIVPFDQRIAEVEKRKPNPDPAVEKLLRRPYWDVEREVGHQVERMLFEILRARRVQITNADDIPKLILAEIVRRLSVMPCSEAEINAVTTQ